MIYETIKNIGKDQATISHVHSSPVNCKNLKLQFSLNMGPNHYFDLFAMPTYNCYDIIFNVTNNYILR